MYSTRLKINDVWLEKKWTGYTIMMAEQVKGITEILYGREIIANLPIIEKCPNMKALFCENFKNYMAVAALQPHL